MHPRFCRSGCIAKTKKMTPNLCGSYDIQKSSLLSQTDPSLHLVIATRRNPTPTKPVNYLLFRYPSGRHEYLSSLFPVNAGEIMQPQAYSLDYLNQYLILEVDRERGIATIRPAGNHPKKPGFSKSPSISIGILSPTKRQFSSFSGARNTTFCHNHPPKNTELP
jgi:hypothetical protein